MSLLTWNWLELMKIAVGLNSGVFTNSWIPNTIKVGLNKTNADISEHIIWQLRCYSVTYVQLCTIKVLSLSGYLSVASSQYRDSVALIAGRWSAQAARARLNELGPR